MQALASTLLLAFFITFANGFEFPIEGDLNTNKPNVQDINNKPQINVVNTNSQANSIIQGLFYCPDKWSKGDCIKSCCGLGDLPDQIMLGGNVALQTDL